MEWLTRNAATITNTYGRQRTTAPSNENRMNSSGSSSVNAVKVFDFDSVFSKDEETTSQKRLKQERPSKALKEQVIEPKNPTVKCAR